MKTIIIVLILSIFNFKSFAVDGEYICHVNQLVSYKSLANRILNVSHQLDKITELKNKGERVLALKQIQYANRDIARFRKVLAKSNFCYSLKDKVDYLKVQSLKFELTLSLDQRELKKTDTCGYFIEKIKVSIENSRSIANKPHEQYVEISRSLRKTNHILAKKSCSKVQKKELGMIFDKQTVYLDKLYLKVKS
ncbi:hypothetical protein A9Q84_09860 [Halobacteriovorax marinus]|uniref:Uncharacterized protein n=1 Tax=Halobacteriovorax marinus TaxID=97084 RepID=A0A1Y5FCQ5_9BACT|nr:hypothetical protein A9Q84_09860 [Halobacteriovorax marinus]